MRIENGVKPAVPWAILPAREQATFNARAKRINDGLEQVIVTASQKRKNKKAVTLLGFHVVHWN